MPPRRPASATTIRNRTLFGASALVIVPLVQRYGELLDLPLDDLRVTTDRAEFAAWLGRRVSSAYGGAYVFLRHADIHAILINLQRIDTSSPRAIEVVVAEELVHMRDFLDGDRRRHAKHGYDRIAHRVAALTGASLEEIRSALVPVRRQPYRYVYACPSCNVRVPRKRRGTWSCARCAPAFDRRYLLRLVDELPPPGPSGDVQ
jgi:predicted SprT family Zn-dependent metalloprotease